MKKLVLAGGALLCLSSALSAQSITQNDLKEIQSGFNKDASTKAIQNILTTTSNITAAALNHEMEADRPLFQVQGECERNYRSEKFGTLLDVHIDERIASVYYAAV